MKTALGRTLLLVPTYNERDNVERLAGEILELGLDLDILFLDDRSPDGTGAILDGLASRHPSINVLHRSGKFGIGSAHLQGIALAYEKGYTRLITMDADFTHPPSYIPEFLRLSELADVVVGSRYQLLGSLDEWTFFRRLLTHGGHFLTRTLLGLKEDASSAYRLYRLDKIPSEIFAIIRSTGYAFFFESLYVLRLNGFTPREIGIVLPKRASGQSKMGLIDACQGLLRLFWMCVVIAADRKRLLLSGRGKT